MRLLSCYSIILVVLAASCSKCGPAETTCQSDSDCSSSQRCDLSSNTCVARAPFADAATDAAVADVPVFDAATDASACASATCPDNTVCIETSGGHECRCGSTNVCREDEECVPRQIAVDGGTHPAVRCCPRGQAYCDDRCVDVAGDPHHCGRCFNSCPTLVCADSACACTETWQCTGNPPANTVPRCVTDGGVLTSGDAGGRIGACDFTQCVQGFGDCVDSAPGCESDLAIDPEHCGRCGASAVQTQVFGNDAGQEALPVTSVCVNGVPQCGGEPACDGGRICIGPFTVDGGRPNGNERCVQCATARATNCPTGNICCNGTCVGGSPTELDQHCGCRPNPYLSDDGDDCTAFQLGVTSDLGGLVCVDSSTANHVDRMTVYGGRCGCNASGVEQCSELNYTSNDLWVGVLLAGLCNRATHQCEPQSVDQCGIVGGVVAPFDAGTVGGLAGATCNPATGGPLCDDYIGTADGIGECGCDLLGAAYCMTPVPGATNGRQHVVANSCSFTRNCICGSWPNGPCDMNSPRPDCCNLDCTDLATNIETCGTCDTRCEASTLAGSSHAAQCTYNSASRAAQCFCNGAPSDDVNLAQCPTNGGGGGTYCVIGRMCVCPQNNAEPCPIGSYCCSGDFGVGQADGCCTRNCVNLNAANRCKRPNGCGGDATKWTCTNGSTFWCCAEGTTCGNMPNSCEVPMP